MTEKNQTKREHFREFIPEEAVEHAKTAREEMRKSLEAIVHTFIALLKARWYSSDIVHIHAIGPSLLTPLARSEALP